MKKIFILLTIILLLIPVSGVYAAENTTFTVKFYVTETNFSSQQVAFNGVAVAPSSPLKAGHTFKGWRLSNDDVTAVVNIASYKIVENVNFYAVFLPNQYKVTFVYYNTSGLKTESVQSVFYNRLPQIPDVPMSVNGSAFLGWDCEIVPAMTAAVYTAQMAEELFVVKFFDENGDIIETLYKSGLQSVFVPQPEVAGKIAKGWSLTKGGTPLPGTFRINDDIELYAVYKTNLWWHYTNLPLVWQVAVPVIAIILISILISAIKKQRR